MKNEIKEYLWCRNCGEETWHERIAVTVQPADPTQKCGLLRKIRKQKVSVFACKICRCERTREPYSPRKTQSNKT